MYRIGSIQPIHSLKNQQMSYQEIVVFHNDFTLSMLSGKQPEQSPLAHTWWQPTSGCIAIFHKYCCFTMFTKHESIITNLTMKSLGVYYWYVKIPQCGYMKHGLTNWACWGRDKMAAISQTTFTNAFSWMKMFELRLKFHWSLFPSVHLTMAWHRTDDKPLSEPMMS